MDNAITIRFAVGINGQCYPVVIKERIIIIIITSTTAAINIIIAHLNWLK